MTLDVYQKLHFAGFVLHSIMILIGFILVYKRLGKMIK